MAYGSNARVDDDPKYIAPRKTERTTRALRDMLFDEIEELRSGSGDPNKSLAVSKLAGQIINIARAEMEFHRIIATDGASAVPTDLLEQRLPQTPMLGPTNANDD